LKTEKHLMAAIKCFDAAEMQARMIEGIGSAALKGDQTCAYFTGFTVPFWEQLFP